MKAIGSQIRHSAVVFRAGQYWGWQREALFEREEGDEREGKPQERKGYTKHTQDCHLLRGERRDPPPRSRLSCRGIHFPLYSLESFDVCNELMLVVVVFDPSSSSSCF